MERRQLLLIVYKIAKRGDHKEVVFVLKKKKQ